MENVHTVDEEKECDEGNCCEADVGEEVRQEEGKERRVGRSWRKQRERTELLGASVPQTPRY